MADRDALTARALIASLDPDYVELGLLGPEFTDGPLEWSGYGAARERARERTGERESVVCATGRVGAGSGAAPTPEAVLIAFEFGFLGGSLGEATGDRIEAAYAHARAHRLPVVSLVATGGSRMQEGMRALTQLQRVARQTVLTRRAGLPQLAVVRDPTTGGGWATLAAGADVVLALPGAQVGFAGSRVRPADADPWAYTAEGQHAAGHIDTLTQPVDLSDTLGRWLTLLAVPPAPARRAEPPHALTTGPLPADGAEAVRRTRSPERPRADAYLDAYFDWREEIRGDRTGATDPGVRCGFGHRDGRTVAYAAQCGTATRPAGFRTAARLVRTADRLGIPVLTLIDTPGAANDAAAEQGGAGPAIADLFAAVAEAEVPVTSLLVGEGGSGGALALAAPGHLWVTPDSYFSVIAPELAAAILKRPPEEIPATADALRLRPQDAVELGVARGVVPGPT
ncbi:carboxyl transferase domain-containing protein [Streptomyces koyangensis]|uniref:Acetyl-coenzyme A carboxylase carboxyl transferase subunits beta/alpha n=1 Tax=Streptomyces koyangensis TaxID=188770 RepID=A0A385DDE2_9ACTN|nr:carboxyl transferase domain-containing protein [Streptomyces koyangensis]AXQ56316.1 acetyl-CoA carboxylase [Streptomyces koyangensis]